MFSARATVFVSHFSVWGFFHASTLRAGPIILPGKQRGGASAVAAGSQSSGQVLRLQERKETVSGSQTDMLSAARQYVLEVLEWTLRTWSIRFRAQLDCVGDHVHTSGRGVAQSCASALKSPQLQQQRIPALFKHPKNGGALSLPILLVGALGQNVFFFFSRLKYFPRCYRYHEATQPPRTPESFPQIADGVPAPGHA